MIRRILLRLAVILLCLGTIACSIHMIVQINDHYDTRPQAPINEGTDRLVHGDYDALLARPDGWQRIVTKPVISPGELAIIDGVDDLRPLSAELLRQFYGCTDDQVKERMPAHNGLKEGYTHLIRQDEGSLYVGSEPDPHDPALLFTQAPTDEVLELTQGFKLSLEVTPLARDSLVFFTHKDNPVDSLTLEQVRDIYAGRITNWRQVGGEDRPIANYQRVTGSPIQELMQSLVMKQWRCGEPVRRTIYISKGTRIEGVAEYENTPDAIGYATGYYWQSIYAGPDTKVLRIDGLAPTPENVASGAYPLYTAYVSVLRGDEPADAPGRLLRDWLMTDEGRRVIAAAGFCPLKGDTDIVTADTRKEAIPHG